MLTQQLKNVYLNNFVRYDCHLGCFTVCFTHLLVQCILECISTLDIQSSISDIVKHYDVLSGVPINLLSLYFPGQDEPYKSFGTPLPYSWQALPLKAGAHLMICVGHASHMCALPDLETGV